MNPVGLLTITYTSVPLINTPNCYLLYFMSSPNCTLEFETCFSHNFPHNYKVAVFQMFDWYVHIYAVYFN